MSREYPVRSESHQMEESSERFFREKLPRNWTAEKLAVDYGVDLRVDLFEVDKATGLELLVQLKASAEPTNNARETETVQLNVSTYNYLWDKLQVAMLVKFIESEREAYWLLFTDILDPPQDQSTFTIHIPRENRLSNIDWSIIQTYVQHVHHKKLAANRPRTISTQNEDT
jgi:Domain of unknown function (DUF4365)